MWDMCDEPGGHVLWEGLLCVGCVGTVLKW